MRKLEDQFRRTLPDDPRYKQRLAQEYELINYFNFEKHLLRVREILDLADGIPYLTRGSAGASLVCYLLKISNIDPIKYNIPLARFMNRNRKDYPDIDIDFPAHLREKLFRRVYSKWKGHVARISNIVTYGPKSALRQAVREAGFRQRYSRFLTPEDILGYEKGIAARERAAELEGQPMHYSLHCGGIVFFDDGVPKDLKIGPNQVRLTKDEVEERGLVKIDLLSNRGLSQLMAIDNTLQPHQYPEIDAETSSLFCKGDNIGLTFAESPTCRNAFLAIQPQHVDEVALSLAVVRPMAGGAFKSDVLQTWQDTRDVSDKLIYEDDAIIMVQKALNCSEEEADRYRKAFKSQDFATIMEFQNRCEDPMVPLQLSRLKKYGFCKAHAISYGRLVWALAYQKAHNPKAFWHSTLNNCNSYYRPWVHMREAAVHWNIRRGKAPWKIYGDSLVSDSDQPVLFSDPEGDYLERSWWSDKEFLSTMGQKRDPRGFTFFKGLIAAGKEHWNGNSFVTYLTIGTDNGEYLDLYFTKLVDFEQFDWVKGSGINYTNLNAQAVRVDAYKFGRIEF